MSAFEHETAVAFKLLFAELDDLIRSSRRVIAILFGLVVIVGLLSWWLL